MSESDAQPIPDMSGNARRWLGIGEASDLLGVDQTTLRRWSNEGKVPVFLTPGGHRRYAEDDLLAFAKGARRPRRFTSEALTQASLSRYRHDRYVTDVRRRPWYGDYNAETVAEHRKRGLAMVTLAVRYVSTRDDRDAILADACVIAAEYGHDSAAHGLGITDAVQMYLRARTPILQGVIQFLEAGAVSTSRTGRVFTDVSEFMDRTLVAMIAQYERDAHGAGENG